MRIQEQKKDYFPISGDRKFANVSKLPNIDPPFTLVSELLNR